MTRGDRQRGGATSERLWGPLYVAPAVAVIIGLFAVPLVSIVRHAFTHWDGITPPVGIGTKNFAALLHDPTFATALKNNLLFAISVPVELVAPLLLAFWIYERYPGWRFFRATYFLPCVLPTVIVGILAAIFLQYDGPVNEALRAVGLGFLAANWLGSAHTAIPVIIVALIWANFGYNVLIYLSGMATIDPSLVEAAHVDGAKSLQVLRRVIVPQLRRTMELVLVTSTITAFAAMFTYVYTITNGGPGFSTYSADFYMYYQAFVGLNQGYASAIGVALIALMAVLGFFQIRLITGRASS
jgi:raffinose/stachyose/melibiose transport system permease protein